MRMRRLAAGAFTAIGLTLTACGAPATPAADPSTGAPSSPSVTPNRTATSSASGETTSSAEQGVIGTVVRFSAGSHTVDVTIDEDTPATRDLLAMLPMTLTPEEFNGREKIAYLPRELAHEGSPGSDPEDGDLIYFVPWGNIGFYYNTAGVGYSDQTLHLGTYQATPEELAGFDGQETTVAIVH